MANLNDLKWFVLRYVVPFVGFGAFLAGIFFIFQGLILQRELVEKKAGSASGSWLRPKSSSCVSRNRSRTT